MLAGVREGPRVDFDDHPMPPAGAAFPHVVSCQVALLLFAVLWSRYRSWRATPYRDARSTSPALAVPARRVIDRAPRLSSPRPVARPLAPLASESPSLADHFGDPLVPNRFRLRAFRARRACPRWHAFQTMEVHLGECFHELIVSRSDTEVTRNSCWRAPSAARTRAAAKGHPLQTCPRGALMAPEQLPAGITRPGSRRITRRGRGTRAPLVVLVHPIEAEVAAGRISVLSPVGLALLGRAAGAVVHVATPRQGVTAAHPGSQPRTAMFASGMRRRSLRSPRTTRYVRMLSSGW